MSQPDSRVRERLLDALDRPRPFRRFKDALQDFPQVREAWHRHEDGKLKDAAREWLAYHHVAAELVEAPPPEPSPPPDARPHRTER